jgi:hypothetical protein
VLEKRCRKRGQLLSVSLRHNHEETSVLSCLMRDRSTVISSLLMVDEQSWCDEENLSGGRTSTQGKDTMTGRHDMGDSG